MRQAGEVAVVIPARNEADRIQATVSAAIGLPGVAFVVVVDDGSSDDTAVRAGKAGAAVMRHARSRGKGAAMETGAEAVRLLEQREGRDGERHLLFLDADLGETAGRAGPLTEPVLVGTADMTIAVFTTTIKLGGHGLVVGISGAGIRRATGWQPRQPLNGQRCLTRAAFEAARPLAHGFGVETAMTIDLLRKGLRVTEVEVDLAHRATGTDLKAQLHRARQLTDVARVVFFREVKNLGSRGERQRASRSPGRGGPLWPSRPGESNGEKRRGPGGPGGWFLPPG
ncbi:MAG TPA: glycosyltransferase family 2 protein [Streptosporangiaceae bacterium]